MHSRVLELSSSFLEKDNYASEFALPDWFVGYIADYTDQIFDEKEREESIQWVASYIKGIYKEGRLIITKECCENFLLYKISEFKKVIASLGLVNSLDSFLSYETEYQVHLLNDAYNDEYGFWIFDEGDFETLDTFLKNAYFIMKNENKEELIYYVGSVWDYHL